MIDARGLAGCVWSVKDIVWSRIWWGLGLGWGGHQDKGDHESVMGRRVYYEGLRRGVPWSLMEDTEHPDCPECVQGKHINCTLDVINDADQTVTCGCWMRNGGDH